MKTALFLGLMGVGLVAATPAKATSLTYNPGDLLMGFFDPTGTQDYIVDLGPASTFRDATKTLTLTSIGNIGQDLSDTFGSDWNSQPTLLWGFFGANNVLDTTVNSDPYATIYAGKAEVTFGTKGTAYASGSVNTLGIPAGFIDDIGVAYGGGSYTSTSNSNVGTVQNISDTNSFGNPQQQVVDDSGQGFSFGYFQNALGNFGNGTSDTAIDLFRLVPGSVANRSTSLEGTFTISDAGLVTFVPAPVPEPSTVVMLTAGALFFVIVMRRRRSVPRV